MSTKPRPCALLCAKERDAEIERLKAERDALRLNEREGWRYADECNQRFQRARMPDDLLQIVKAAAEEGINDTYLQRKAWSGILAWQESLK